LPQPSAAAVSTERNTVVRDARKRPVWLELMTA